MTQRIFSLTCPTFCCPAKVIKNDERSVIIQDILWHIFYDQLLKSVFFITNTLSYRGIGLQMTVQIFMAISKYRFNCRSNNRTNMELNSANKNPSHDNFIVCIDKQAYKLSLQITKNVKNSEKLK